MKFEFFFLFVDLMCLVEVGLVFFVDVDVGFVWLVVGVVVDFDIG